MPRESARSPSPPGRSAGTVPSPRPAFGPRPPVSPQRILLIRLSHLGDVVHALPVHHALREAYPGARLAWVTQPEFAGLLEGLEGLDEVFHFRRHGGARAWLELRDALEAFGPDLVVDAQGNLKSALCALSSGGARRLGPAPADWRERLGAHAATEHAEPAAGPHALDRARALARAAAGPHWSGTLRLDPGLSAAERAAGRARWRELAPAGDGPVLVAHLSAEGDVRAWPQGHWEALALGLARSGRPALYVSGPAEAAAGHTLARRLEGEARAAHWVGQRGLRELAGVLAAGADSGARFVGCDSGPLHLAVACGLPVTCLAGPQSHLRTGPWPVPGRNARSARDGGRHAVLRAAVEPSCAPCLARRCSHPDGPVCMRRIDPSLVLEHATRHLA